MKRILTTTAVVLAMAAPAVADTDMLREKLENQFENVDVASLTDAQVSALYAAVAGTDGQADVQAEVDAIVRDDQYVMDSDAMMADPDMVARVGGDNNIRDYVADALEAQPIDVDVDSLSDEQVAALYLELSSGEQADASDLEAIIQ